MSPSAGNSPIIQPGGCDRSKNRCQSRCAMRPVDRFEPSKEYARSRAKPIKPRATGIRAPPQQGAPAPNAALHIAPRSNVSSKVKPVRCQRQLAACPSSNDSPTPRAAAPSTKISHARWTVVRPSKSELAVASRRGLPRPASHWRFRHPATRCMLLTRGSLWIRCVFAT